MCDVRLGGGRVCVLSSGGGGGGSNVRLRGRKLRAYHVALPVIE